MRVLIALLMSLLVLSGFSVAAAEPLSPEEQAIAQWIDDHVSELESLIESQVNINSGTRNPPGVNKVGDLLAIELGNLGFTIERMQLPEPMQRGGHVFARRNGKQGKRLLLIGHLDTVFEAQDPFQTFVRDGDWASGPGISDMKSGNAIIVFALRALAAADALTDTQITVAYSGDEEDPGAPLAETRKALIEAGKWADIALGFESGVRDDGFEWATISRRSASEWCLEVTGKQGHSSGIFSESSGAGAIFEAARILDAFYQRVRGEEYLTFNAGTILGGTDVTADCDSPGGETYGKTNVIPRRAIVRGGMRTISNAQLERAREAMRAVVEQSLPQTSAEIHFTDGYPAMDPSSGNMRLRDELSAINIALGGREMPVLDPSRRGAADISFVAPYTNGLAGMGAYGSGEHSPAERLDLTSLPIATKRAAILMYRLTR